MENLISDVFFFFKGRVALYALLKAIVIHPGDEVILPGFTCVVVPNAIIYLGGKPVYVDIGPKTFNIDTSKIESKITGKTTAIIAQNTFGLSSDLDPILDIAKRYNLKVIEDCAHGYGGSYKGKTNGTVADAAFFSTQWSKPFSTGLGGIAVTNTNNPEIASKLRIESDSYPYPDIKERLVLWMLLQGYDFMMKPAIYWPAIKTYRFLSKVGLVTGSSSGDELISPVKPDGFEKRMAKFQQKRAKLEMESFEENLKHRLWAAKRYDEIFNMLGLEKPYRPGYALHTFLRYAFLVTDKQRFLRKAEENRIEVGDWFLSPLHPIEKDLLPWGYKKGMCPVAESICERIVNLPTHKRIHDKYITRLENFLEKMKVQRVL